MARLLFLVELIVAVVVGPLVFGLDTRLSMGGAGFLVLVLVVSLGSALAVYGPGSTMRALSDAWATAPLGPRVQTSLAVWGLWARVAPVAGLLGALVSAAVAAQAVEGAREALVWAAFALAWGLLGLVLAGVFRGVVERLGSLPVPRAVGQLGGVTGRFGLTPREAEVATAVLEGATYRDTAAQLGIAPATVKSHLLKVYEKTGTGTKIELLRLVEAETARLHQREDGPIGEVGRG